MEKIYEQLKTAIENNDAQSVEDVISQNPNLLEKKGKKKYAKGRTPLLYALVCKSYDAARILIEAGANVNAKDSFGDGWCCIYVAVALNGDPEILRMLLEKGADPNVIGKDKNFPLRTAFISAKNRPNDPESKKRFEILLDNGASLDFKSKLWKSVNETFEYLREIGTEFPSWMNRLIEAKK